MLSKIFDNTRWLVSGAVLATILYTRSLESLYCCVGGVMCGILAKVLKHVIRQPRPGLEARRPAAAPTTTASSAVNEGLNPGLTLVRKLKSSLLSSKGQYGMPSSHSQATGFFASYITFALLDRVSGSQPWKWPVLVLLNGAGISVAISRVTLRYHTWPQVLVGLVVGYAFGWLWLRWYDVVLAALPHGMK
ncbi:PAP2 superfamily-domain-containing protein [Polychytrium aggregatum]|uniref:PAP2 superfamily-domain-containing protein n=1 Tax=Polychytrium aggregatum TaxID=110093 RepID=UPI0022FE7943|nr:PAP2 superfamily-domain-containing protein [Polychytrium aggregatum]KAI9208315.1 PAP2 superfamily-domain-containing protein [Polychytrium aggregatum]